MDFKSQPHQKNLSGVYKIYNSVDSRVYIGSAVNLYVRYRQHFSRLKKNTHHNKKLQNFFNKYGSQSLTFEVVEICRDCFLIDREQFYMDLFDCYKRGFNMTALANSNLGKTFSDEVRQKVSQSVKKLWACSLYRQKITMAKKGSKLSEETKAKMSQAHMGRNTWQKGRLHSDEVKWKMSLSHKGKRVNTPDRVAKRIETTRLKAHEIIHTDDVKAFFAANPSLKTKSVELKYGIPQGTIQKLLADKVGLTPKLAAKILAIVEANK